MGTKEKKLTSEVEQNEAQAETGDRLEALRGFFDGRSLLERAACVVALQALCSDDPDTCDLINEYSDQWEAEIRERAAGMYTGTPVCEAEGGLEIQFAAGMLAEQAEPEPEAEGDKGMKDELQKIYMGLDTRTRALFWLYHELQGIEGFTRSNLSGELMGDMIDTLNDDAVRADPQLARLYGMAEALALTNRMG